MENKVCISLPEPWVFSNLMIRWDNPKTGEYINLVDICRGGGMFVTIYAISKKNTEVVTVSIDERFWSTSDGEWSNSAKGLLYGIIDYDKLCGWMAEVITERTLDIDDVNDLHQLENIKECYRWIVKRKKVGSRFSAMFGGSKNA